MVCTLQNRLNRQKRSGSPTKLGENRQKSGPNALQIAEMYMEVLENG